ncbi:MAG: DEAD/DEAH box helicase [archaeon]
MECFRELGIIEPILKSIEEMHFEEPSEIQKKAIPLVIAGKDILAGSATGSGKTLAFGCGIIQNIVRGNGVQALVLAPTRELAEQATESLRNFSKYKPLRIISVYGGVAIGPQIAQLKTADVVVGTPGRILDHLERRTIKLSDIKILVLDEADRMLDMGFRYDVEKIIRVCPTKRQTMLFSATIEGDVGHLAQKYMKDPVKVSLVSYVDPSKLTQVYYDVEDRMKFSLLVHLLKNEPAGLVMVFCNTQRNTDFVANNLKFSGIESLAIHGGFSQDKRTRVMKQFNSMKRVYVLVCTDVAARGLDIKGVSHVYNYDIPRDTKTYIHRIGRTARAGEEGKAISILSSRDYDNFTRVQRDRSLRVQREEVPFVERVSIRVLDNPMRGGRDDARGPRRFGNSGRRPFGGPRRR